MIPRRVAALIACHNRRLLTLAAVEAVLAQRLPQALSVVVILVDDGSTDGTGAEIARRFPQVRVLHADGSLYWNGAMALAQRAALAEDFDFHLWLNDDVALADGALAELVRIHDGEVEAGRAAPIVVGATVDPVSGRPTYGGHARRPGFHPFRFERILAEGGAPRPCDAFNGNCVLVPGAAAAALGPIDQAFSGGQPLGDTDYGLRAGWAGIPMLVAPSPVGGCRANDRSVPWEDPSQPLGRRLKTLSGPLGPVRRQTLAFYRRHGGALWLGWWLIHVCRCLWAGVRVKAAAAPARPRFAMMEPVLPWYRLSMLARLRDRNRLEFKVFHGNSHPHGEEDCPPPQGVAHVRRRNWFWPWGGDRILWCGHVWEVLSGGYDVVMLPEHVYTVSNWLIWMVSRILGRPKVILTGHFNLSAKGPGPLSVLRRAWLRGADYLAAYSPSGERQCRAIGVAAHRVEVLLNTLDVEAVRAELAAAGASPDAVRRELGLGERAVFLFVGRLYRNKQVPLAAKAVAALGRPASLVVVGEGADGRSLDHMAETGYPIVRLGALRDGAGLARLFSVAEAAVMPDSAGLGVVHAFAHGVPVILGPGAHHGVEAEYVRPGENGLIAEQLTPQSLAAEMERLLSDPDLARRLRQGAAAAAETLNMDGYVQRLEALVERAARG